MWCGLVWCDLTWCGIACMAIIIGHNISVVVWCFVISYDMI